MTAEHRVQLFSEGNFVDGDLSWGWQCFTCRDEGTGFGNASTAADEAESHAALPPADAGDEPDPIGDIANVIGRSCECPDPRTCKDCRVAATLIWTSSPGHREAWWAGVRKALADAIVDLCWRATPRGTTDDGDIAFYLLTKGTVHRLIGAAQCAGIPAAFRSQVAEEETP